MRQLFKSHVALFFEKDTLKFKMKGITWESEHVIFCFYAEHV